jgi:hypothetical protein
MAQNAQQPNSPGQAILVMRIIGGSMALGVTLFALVSWYLHQQDTAPATGLDSGLMFNLFLALFLLAALGAMYVFRSRVGPVIERPPEDDRWRARASEIQGGLILAWGIADGAALFGQVIYFLTGHALAGVLGLALIWGAVALTWPKKAWL